MAQGISACGDFCTIIDERDYFRDRDLKTYDVCVFYGLEGKTPQLFADFKSEKKAVYVDLGYWGRREGGRWTGYHKIVVNDRHPTNYFQGGKPKPHDRYTKFHVEHARQRKQRYEAFSSWNPLSATAPILLAGMGDKGARAEGYEPEQWERSVIDLLKHHTSRQILYRPKPSWKGAKPIEGCGFSHRDVDVTKELQRSWCVVTHHSNVAVDALVMGVPVYCWSGVASLLAMPLSDLGRINTSDELLPRAGKILQWCADLAYTQWNVEEMKQGLPWRHLKQEGLI